MKQPFLSNQCLSVAVLFALLNSLLTGTASAQKPDAASVIEKYRSAAIAKWESHIAALEAEDQQQTDPHDGILFIGSSSIRRWSTIAKDVAPYRGIERGYGGAKFTDLAVFAERLIQPHHFRAMVVFVANDVVGKPDDRPLDDVESAVKHIIRVANEHQPNAPVLIVEVTPTEARFASWDKQRGVNAMLREVALTTPNCYFVPTAGHYLRPDGQPRRELFVDDRLHLNSEGYRLWGLLIRRRLDEVLRLQVETSSTDPSE